MPDENGQQGFVSTLPEELRGNESLKKFSDVGGMAKSYVELEKMIGGRVKLPDDKSTIEEIQDFRRKMGVPEKIEDYGTYEGIDPDDMADIVKAAHEEGLTKKQFERLVKVSQGKTTAKIEKIFKETQTKAEETLKGEWGDKYEKNLADAKRAMQELAPEGFQKLIAENPTIGNNPDVIKMFSKLWVDMKEAAFHTNRAALTPEDIDQKIRDIEANPAFNDRGNVHWEVLRKERSRLFKLKYPE
jgi:uncharacterized protein YqgV (UPF0045/DUF77 family)